MATANNHAMDKDWAGLVNTLERLDEAGLAHVGTYRSADEKAASDPLIVDIKGIKVAFINYTESVNGIKTPVEHQAYALDYLRSPSQVVEEAAAAREAGAEVVIAVLHWGPEYVTKPSAEQVGMAQGDEDFAGLLASGVDVILGSHPHVVQPAVCVKQQTPDGVKNTYVVYSLGNIVSGMNSWRTLSGAIVYVHIKKTGRRGRGDRAQLPGSHHRAGGRVPSPVARRARAARRLPATGRASARALAAATRLGVGISHRHVLRPRRQHSAAQPGQSER